MNIMSNGLPVGEGINLKIKSGKTTDKPNANKIINAKPYFLIVPMLSFPLKIQR